MLKVVESPSVDEGCRVLCELLRRSSSTYFSGGREVKLTRICREFGILGLEGWVLVVLEMAVLSRRM